MANLSLIRWAGGKGRQLNDLLPFIPDGRIYCEPFGGGASVLLNKSRSEIEVYNDLDASLVNLFQVVRDDRTFEQLASVLEWTPYSREMYMRSLEHENEPDPVMSAAKFYTMINQSISGKRLAGKWDWARAKSDNLADRWMLRQEKLGAIHGRLQHVQIECRDALDILHEWDSPETVFYCDPPYVLDTRKGYKYYAVEPGDEYHKELVVELQKVQGSVVLSGYTHPIYDDLETAGWIKDSYKQYALVTMKMTDEERDPRREVVWRNPRAVAYGLKVPLPGLFWDELVDPVDPDTGAEIRTTQGNVRTADEP